MTWLAEVEWSTGRTKKMSSESEIVVAQKEDGWFLISNGHNFHLWVKGHTSIQVTRKED